MKKQDNPADQGREAFRGPPVTLSMTREQFWDLILLVYLGHWMASATKVEPEKRWDDAADAIFSKVAEVGFEGVVEYDEKDKTWYPTSVFDEAALLFIGEYNEDNFREELIFRLADRDFFEEYTKDQFKGMTSNERFEASAPFEERYEEEVDAHGITRLRIVES